MYIYIYMGPFFPQIYGKSSVPDPRNQWFHTLVSYVVSYLLFHTFWWLVFVVSYLGFIPWFHSWFRTLVSYPRFIGPAFRTFEKTLPYICVYLHIHIDECRGAARRGTVKAMRLVSGPWGPIELGR